eukprot:GHUV01015979.1.p1 GENE.GHUV01015979.1~~GHUV01015979.1.p1  ORF type:complete len:801 (+),score=251.73 GHUV01015979.1:135-2405(+)
MDKSSDINPDGACKPFVTSFCEGVEPGDGQVADCLAEYQRGVEAQMDAEDRYGVHVKAEADMTVSGGLSDECNEEVMQFKIQRSTNINRNTPLAKACADDANKYCNMTWFSGYRNGSVIACLRDIRDKLKPECKKQVFKVQLDASYDYRVDQTLHEACRKDAETLCPGVKLGGGRIQECLKKQRLKLGWDCSAELFRKEVEDTDDIRLSIRLFRECLADKKQYCADVAPGQAMAKQCLEEHIDQLSHSCRAEMESVIEQRVRIFRLDSRLRKACQSEIYNTCAYLGDMDTLSDYDEVVVNCLQDFASELKSQACRMQVHKYVELAAQDIRFDVPLADACYEDRQKLCANVPPGSARVIRCLQNNRDKLSGVCRATLFDEEVRFSENIDFQFPMKQACLQEIEMYCKDIPHGNARVIRCLQNSKTKKDFGKTCLAEVMAFEQKSSQDYRFNFRLKKMCKGDIERVCKDVCHPDEDQVCGGQVLRCLTEKLDELKSEDCRKEVYYFQKMEVSNYHNDVILAAQCRNDVEKFCKNVQPGDGRVHACLREHRKEISDGCRREEMILEQQEAEHIELRPNLLKACSNERQTFCGNVQPGSARVFRCLAEKLADPDFGPRCRYEVISKLQRRQANWKLDPTLRRACRADVADLCKAEDTLATETGEVYRCLVHNHDDLDPGCKKELGRAVHMAFFIWSPGAILTRECDADITQVCLKNRPSMDRIPGAVGSCLADVVSGELQHQPVHVVWCMSIKTAGEIMA